MRLILRWFYLLLILTACLVAVTLIVPTLPIANNYKIYVVLSGSMEPELATGGIVFTRPASTYGLGDIISFRSNSQSSQITTHRIVHIKSAPEGRIFITKGDANNAPDPQSITQSQIIGRSFLSLPYLGYVVEFLKSPRGFILFVVVPATIISYEEVKSLLRLLRQRPEITPPPPSSVTSSPILSQVTLVLVALVLGTSFVSIARSFFSDRELSTNNIISVPTPTPSP